MIFEKTAFFKFHESKQKQQAANKLRNLYFFEPKCLDSIKLENSSKIIVHPTIIFFWSTYKSSYDSRLKVIYEMDHQSVTNCSVNWTRFHCVVAIALVISVRLWNFKDGGS